MDRADKKPSTLHLQTPQADLYFKPKLELHINHVILMDPSKEPCKVDRTDDKPPRLGALRRSEPVKRRAELQPRPSDLFRVRA